MKNGLILEQLVMGALLHDIGKFRMRAGVANTPKDHSQLGAEWLREYESKGLPPGVSNFAEWHHRKYYEDVKTSNSTLLVEQADNYAAMEREEKENEKFKPYIAPLRSVMSQINLNSKDTAPGPELSEIYFPLTELGNQIIFPTSNPNISQEKYKELWEKFKESFEKWVQVPSINGLLNLLEKYTSFIPSETQWNENNPIKNPDISLFDHAKLTAAITSCLYYSVSNEFQDTFNDTIHEKEIQNQDKDYFLFVGGDLSGVQKFIYTISSKAALKTLRARSFFLELLNEHIISQILEETGLSRANVIYSGGARFYLLLPNTEIVKSVVERVKETTNKWLWDNFAGKLLLVLGHKEFNGNTFKDKKASELWKDLGEILSEAKKKKYDPYISEMLQPQEPVLADSSCQICHRDDVVTAHKPPEGFDNVCELCCKFVELGKDLSQVTYISTTPGKLQPQNDTFQFPIFDVKNGEANLIFHKDAKDLGANETNYQFRYDFYTENQYQNIIPLSIANYSITKDYGTSTLDFKSTAHLSRGAPLLGVLRMDVDNLGKIFLQGLPEEKKTFTRLSTLSRQLSLFFKDYLTLLLKGIVPGDFSMNDLSEKDPGKNGRNVHVIYAGGDDLFLVGAWDDIVETSIDINNAFDQYTSQNPFLTISGGLVVHNSDYPLYRLAQLAHKAETAAKNDDKNEKNRIALFFDPTINSNKDFSLNQITKWSEIDNIIEPLKLFLNTGRFKEKFFSSDYLSHNDINKLFQLINRYQKDGIMYMPTLAYTLGRIKGLKSKHPELCEMLMQINKLPDIYHSLYWFRLLSRKPQKEERNES